MKIITGYRGIGAIRIALLAAMTSLALLTAHPLPSSAQSADMPAASAGQQETASKETGKVMMEVAASIARTSNDAWKIAEGQWRSANAYADGLKTIATATGAAITILLSAMGFLGYTNIKDVKKDIQDEMQKYKSSADKDIENIKHNISEESERREKLISTIIRKEIDLILNESDEKRKKLEEFAQQSSSAAEKIEQFLEQYKSKITMLTETTKVTNDPVGDWRQLIHSNILENETYDPQHRQNTRIVLQNIIDGADAIGVNELFNATNVASQLGYTDQAKKLAELAYKRWPIPIHEARMLRFQVSQGGEAGDKAFRRIMELVSTTPTSNCELIIADGWNVAEERRDYDNFLAAAEKRRLSSDYVPSYLHAVAAQAAVRGGQPGWKDKAEAYLAAAKQAIATESPKSTWFKAAQREIKIVEQWMQPPSPDNNLGGAGINGEILARLLREKLGVLLSDDGEESKDNNANKTIPGNGKGNGRNDSSEPEVQ